MPWTKVQPLLTQRWQWPKGLTETSHFWNLIFGEFDEPNFRGGFPVSPQESQQETSAENPQREVSGMFAIG